MFAALLLCAAALLCVGTTTALYMNQSFLRSVARNQDQEAGKFNSNILASQMYNPPSPPGDYPYSSSDYPIRVLTYPKDLPSGREFNDTITVRNYIPGNASAVSQYRIDYDFKIIYRGCTNGFTYTVNDETKTAGPDGELIFYIAGETLPGRAMSSHDYTFNFYSDDLDSLTITAFAVPVSGSLNYTANQFLAARLTPCTESNIKPFSCVGLYSDRTTGAPADYDAYNYEVLISNGRAEVTVTWDSDVFTLDPFFTSRLSAQGAGTAEEAEYYLPGTTQKYRLENGTGTERSITFVMDYSLGNTDYIIPFYIKGTSKATVIHGFTWSELETAEYIKVTGREVSATP